MLSQRQAKRRAPKRQDWLPNRMFDPVNNPFAIQNLLAREREREDTVFHVDVDGRPEASYAGNTLLKAKEILPPKDFASNRLLEETTRFDHAFHAEYEDTEYAYESEEADSDAEEITTDALYAALSGKTIEITEPGDAADAMHASEVGEAVLQQSAGEASVAAADTEAEAADAHIEGQPTELLASPDDRISGSADIESSAVVTDTADAASPTIPTEAAQAVAVDTESSLAEAEVPASVPHAESDTETPALSESTHGESAAEPLAVQPVADDLAGEAAADLPEPASAGAAESADPEAGAVFSESSPESSGQTEDMQAAPAADAEITDTGTYTETETEPESAEADNAVAAEAKDDATAGSGTDAKLVEDAVSVDQLADDIPAAPPGLSNEAIDSLLQAAREAAYQEGLLAGREQMQAELQQQFDEKISQTNQLLEGLQRLSDDPDTLFEPMKKLAVHLAEQLVRGELTQSPQTISRLVDNCLRELAASGEKAVIVHLNPEDLEQYKPLIAPFGDSIVLRPDATLARGSVRASLDGSVVEDLMDRRVKGIQKSLSQPVAGSWRPALSNPLAQRSPAQPPRATNQAASKPATPVSASDADQDMDSADDDQAEIHAADGGVTADDHSARAEADTEADANHLHGDAGSTEVS